MADVAMPRLSDSMEEGTILKWLKSDGDEVEKGEELVEIETDKANMTYEADESGTLSIVAQEGDTLAVGETICRIGEGGGSADEGSGGAEDEGAGEADEEAEPAEEEQGEDEEAGEEAGDEGAEEEPEPAPVGEEGDAEPDEDEGAGEEEGEEERADGGDAESEEAEQEEEPDREPVATAEEDGAGEEDERDEAPEGAASGGNGRTKASPVARRMARELGVELSALEGTGPGGRIVKADVEAAAGNGKATAAEAEEGEEEKAESEAEEKAEAPAEEQEAGKPAAEEEQDEAPAEEEDGARAEEKAPAKDEKAPAKDEKKPAKEDREAAKAKSGDAVTGRGETSVEELTRLQQTVARRMAESKATAPDFVMTCEVDMEAAVDFRRQLKAAAGDGPAPSFNDLVVKASAFALRAFPRANGAYRDGRFELYSRVNVGIAVAGQDALVVPTIFDVDSKSLGEIARDARTLAERVREGKITPPELASGTFTVSNLGMYGIARFVAVINPPQAAILAVGEMTPRAVVRDGEVVVRPIMELTLSCDHRILYGADAAQFLGHIRERLENPLSLAL